MCLIIYICLLKTNNGFSFYNYMRLTTTLIFMEENCVEKKTTVAPKEPIIIA